jgi:pimeloyl-ACP methyl ester carboxylesterase
VRVRANGIELEVEDSAQSGEGRDRPAVLLIMGLGMQLIAWPQEVVQRLIDAGYRVIRYDNRDIGLSESLDHLGVLNPLWTMLKLKAGLEVRPPYGIADMAADAIGLLDALQIQRAHLVGASMGGMIAQRVAVSAPDRVLSLTSLMSTSGASGLPRAAPDVLRLLLKRPAATDRKTVTEYGARMFRRIGSPGFPTSDADLMRRQEAAYDRSFRPNGVRRHTLAAFMDFGRARELGKITAPTLVIHGKADPLIPSACGEDTARRIPNAKLELLEGVGHDLAPGVVEQMFRVLLPHLAAH